MKRFTDHLAAHPIRLLITLVVPLLLSSILATFAVWQAVRASERNDAAVCKQVNELKQEIYITITDITYMFLQSADALEVQRVFAKRFLPVKDCRP